jgi:hypothetical protein
LLFTEPSAFLQRLLTAQSPPSPEPTSREFYRMSFGAQGEERNPLSLVHNGTLGQNVPAEPPRASAWENEISLETGFCDQSHFG